MKKAIVCLLIVSILFSMMACAKPEASTPAATNPPANSAATSAPEAEKTPEAAAEPDIVIGNLQDISSTTTVWGRSVTWGVTKAVDTINANGGLLGGRKIKLITYDTKNDVNESINAYNRLVQQDKAVVVIGPPTSNIGIALAPIAEESKVPIFGDFMDERATTKEDGSPWGYMFLGEPSCGQQAEIIASYALNELKIKKFAILYDQSNAYAASHAIPFEKAVLAAGGEVVAKEVFQSSDKDYRAQLTKIKKAAPEAIFMPNYVQQNALIYQQARQTGMNQIFLGAASCFYPFAELAGNAVKDVYFPNNVSYEDVKIIPLIDEYKADVKETPSLHLFLGFDNVLIVADAISRANSSDPVAIRDALESTKDVTGLTGKISIDPKTHRPQGLSMYIVKVEGDQYKYLSTYLPK